MVSFLSGGTAVCGGEALDDFHPGGLPLVQQGLVRRPDVELVILSDLEEQVAGYAVLVKHPGGQGGLPGFRILGVLGELA